MWWYDCLCPSIVERYLNESIADGKCHKADRQLWADVFESESELCTGVSCLIEFAHCLSSPQIFSAPLSLFPQEQRLVASVASGSHVLTHGVRGSLESNAQLQEALTSLCILLEYAIKEVARIANAAPVSALLNDVIASRCFRNVADSIELGTGEAPLQLSGALWACIGSPRGLNVRNLLMHGFLLVVGDSEGLSRNGFSPADCFNLLVFLLSAVCSEWVKRLEPLPVAQPAPRGVMLPWHSYCCGNSCGDDSNAWSALCTQAADAIKESFPESIKDLPPVVQQQYVENITWASMHLQRSDSHAFSLILLFPILEHVLRLQYAHRNRGCLLNTDECMRAQDTILYYRFDELLSMRTTPTQKDSEPAAAVLPNELFKGDEVLHHWWYSLLVSPSVSGWRIRDAIFHLRVRLSDVGDSAVATLWHLFVTTCIYFTSWNQPSYRKTLLPPLVLSHAFFA